jgi:hypothetical protein
MKKVLIILGILFGMFAMLIAGVVFLAMNLTSALPGTADAFFKAARAGDMETARSYLSEEFRASTSAEQLQGFLAESALLNYKEASWSNRSINNDRGELTGSVLTDDGGRVPLTIQLVQENDAWKIYHIDRKPAGLQSTADAREANAVVPSAAERTALVKATTRDFSISLDEGDMGHLHGTLSDLWREQITVEGLNDTFATFLDQEITLDLDTMEPVFSGEPMIDSNGVMALTGLYATQPSQVHFTYKYLTERAKWRLVGIDVDIR